jgi:hypothetical protein
MVCECRTGAHDRLFHACDQIAGAQRLGHQFIDANIDRLIDHRDVGIARHQNDRHCWINDHRIVADGAGEFQTIHVAAKHEVEHGHIDMVALQIVSGRYGVGKLSNRAQAHCVENGAQDAAHLRIVVEHDCRLVQIV